MWLKIRGIKNNSKKTKKIMNTTDNNKLIAEFMQDIDKLRHDNTFKTPYYYNSSWDWLMPVIQRVNQTGYAGGITYDLKESLIAVDIDNTYNEVVNFIKWYNVKIAQKEIKQGNVITDTI